MKFFFSLLMLTAACAVYAKTFSWATELKYDFFPKQKMTFINGVVKNTEETASPDIHARYSRKVRVDNFIFTLPGELCETMAACYKADLNGDRIPDYVFVSIKIWNGWLAGLSDVGIFVSVKGKKHVFSSFEARHFEAEVVNSKIMLVKYAFSDDNITLIRQHYTFNAEGQMRLHKAGEFSISAK